MGICPLHIVHPNPQPRNIPYNIHKKKQILKKKIYRIDQHKLEISIQMSNFTSNNYNYYSSVNSNNNEELSKKMKGNSLITYKSSFNVLPNDEKSNWMSIINNMNEVEKAKNDTPDLIEDLNYKKTKSFIKDDISTKENSSKSCLKSIKNEQTFDNYYPSQDLDTMPSVRDEYKNKLNVKSSFEPIFIEKFNNKNDFASQSERTLFFNHNFAPKSLNFNLDNKKSKKKDVEDRDTKTTKTHTNYEKIPQVYMKENIQIKPRINNEDVPNPLQKLKITKERKLSRISSRNSFEELNKDVKDLALTIKDLSVPFPLREKPILDNNIIKPPEKIEEDWNTKRNSEYIENFLKHKNPLRRHLNEFHEENNHDSSCMSRSSLFSMKNYFKNINNLKINDEELNSEEILNTRIRLNNTREHFKEKQMSEEELSEFMNQTNNFLTDNNNENAYDINNFITDMMDIYIDRKKDVNEKSDFLQKEDLKLFEHDKENLNMKLKCLSPVYREMKISARNLEPNKLKENNSEFSVKKRNSMHDFSSYEHRKSTYIQPNFYQKNRDFSQFSNHFSQGNSKETCIEPENKITYRDIKEKINVRRVI